jgi:cell wall-associated NlpC family hydrolase
MPSPSIGTGDPFYGVKSCTRSGTFQPNPSANLGGMGKGECNNLLKRMVTIAGMTGVLLTGMSNLAPQQAQAQQVESQQVESQQGEVQQGETYAWPHQVSTKQQTDPFTNITYMPTRPTQPTQSTNLTTGSATGLQIANYAKQFIGIPYVHGGRSPQTGFDCSGFTSYVYKHFGISISTGPIGQLKQGYQVSKSDMQPGDIVFFHSGSRSGYHEGIYIGNNQMIHAPAPGRGVQITNLSSSWCQSHFAQVRRYF